MIEGRFKNNIESDFQEQKHPLEPVEKEEGLDMELKFTNKERRIVFEFCENIYPETVNYINSNKEGFKKIMLSAFCRRTFHTIPSIKDNTCFIPIKQIPRIDNLRKIFPSLAEDGISMTMKHERQHCLADALDLKKRTNNSVFSVSNFNQIESKTNEQVFDRLRNEVSKQNYIKKVASYYIFINVSEYGAEIFENKRTEKDFIDWLKSYFDFIDEEEIDLYVNEFNNLKEELLNKYNKYIEASHAKSFYDQEDEECEKLRIEAIKNLNEMVK